jgi:hypothetical protein
MHRAVELGIGFAVVGYCGYAVYSGNIRGKFRSYSRDEQPWTFWTSVLITFGLGLMFLFGLVSWRE